MLRTIVAMDPTVQPNYGWGMPGPAPLDRLPCSIARSLDVVGEWWSLLVVRDVLMGVRRFDAIADHLGIPRTTLAARLQRLEEAGVLARRPYSDGGRTREEYVPTAAGRDLFGVLLALLRWGDDHLAGEEGPPVTLTHACGASCRPTVVCDACGEPLRLRDLTPEPSLLGGHAPVG